MTDLKKKALINYMKENDMKPYEFAGLIGMNNSTVYRILNGSRGPGSKFIKNVVEKTNLDYDDFIFTCNSVS